jgi:predicted MFS family arabinose efflux permease
MISQRSPRILFRALQGIGGAGAYALAILCIYEIAPKSKLPTYSGLMSCCLALACLIGPIIGGALAGDSAWRWVFLIKYVHNGDTLSKAMLIVLQRPPVYCCNRHHYDCDAQKLRSRSTYAIIQNKSVVPFLCQS